VVWFGNIALTLILPVSVPVSIGGGGNHCLYTVLVNKVFEQH
jgi:hypothetical protein